MGKAPKEGNVQLHNAHGSGQTCVTFASDNNGKSVLVSCGADGNVCTRDPVSTEVLSSTKPGESAVNIIVVQPSGSTVVTGDEQFVKMHKLAAASEGSAASLNLDRNAGRSPLPIRGLSFSPDGSKLAYAGDSEAIKLCNVKDCVVFRNLKVDGYVRCVAYDPEGTYLAASQADGSLFIFDATSGKQECRKLRAMPKVDATSSACCVLSWHPDGSLLAAPGTDGDVVLYERLSWEATSYLSGGHSAAAGVAVVTFSPNGLYAATGGRDGKVCVWDVTAGTCLSTVKGGSAAVTSLAWAPAGNSLAVADEEGKVGVWQGAVPESLPGPAVSPDELIKRGLQNEDAAGAQQGAESRGVAAMDEDGDEAGGEDDLADFIEEDEGQDLLGRKGAQRGLGGVMRPGRPAAPAGPAPQPAFQPCSTLRAAGGADSRAPKFLCYNLSGCIVSRHVDDHYTVEVSFHDTRKATSRVPLLMDLFGFTMGALSDKGALYASPSSKDAPSMVVYRPFESWAPNSEWSVGLPSGEEALCLAAGHSFLAVATSAQQLRVFSTTGLQTAVISLPGAAVSLASHEHLLAVVTHAGTPLAHTKAQNLHVAVYDLSSGSCPASGPCPINPASTLTWLSFTDEGALVTGDSTGVLRMRSSQFGGSWVPVFDPAVESKGGEVFWPVAIAQQQLYCITCTAQQPYPQVSPRPFFTCLPLRVPVLAVEGGLPVLDSEHLLHGLRLEAQRARFESASTDLEAASEGQELARRQTDADRCLLKIYQAALKVDRQARAFEVVAQLQQPASLQGALKLANYHKAPALAERIMLFIEQRSAMEVVEQHPAVTPLPMKTLAAPGGAAAAAEQGQGVPFSDRGNVQGSDAGGADVSAPPTGGGLTALKAAAASVLDSAGRAPRGGENAAPSGAGGAEGGKRKAPPAPANNPFARKPAKMAKS